MRLGILIIALSINWSTFAQILYSPSQTNEVWIDYSYYDAEFIFIQNTGSKSITLNFENTEAEIPAEWHAAACTNVKCYTDIPEFGSLGTLEPGDQAYFSINLTANETEGDGTITYVITESTNPEDGDTIRFVYHANETGSIIVGPWAKVNYFEGALTVFLRDEHVAADVRIFDLSGSLIFEQKVEGLYSYRLGDHDRGMYILYIEDELGRVHKERLINL